MSEHLPMVNLIAPESPMEKEGKMSALSETMSDYSLTTQHTYDDYTLRTNLKFKRVNSAYIPRKTLSRYGDAFKSMKPFRRSNTSTKEMPIDSVGCVSNTTFNWVRPFRLTKEKLEDVPKTTAGIDALLIPKTTKNDGFQSNSQRLLGIFKYEKQNRGQLGTSMLRVAWKFCSTRILISTLIYSIALIVSLMGPGIFLHYSLNIVNTSSDKIRLEQCVNIQNGSIFNVSDIIHSTHKNCRTIGDYIQYDEIANIGNCLGNVSENLSAFGNLTYPLNENQTTNTVNETIQQCLIKKTKNTAAAIGHQLVFSAGLFGCYILYFFIKNICSWINLRTAIRMRTACITSIYKKAMKSSIAYKLSPHQILSYANEESDIIMKLVEHGGLIFGIIIGLISCLIGSVILLTPQGIWPIFGITGLIIAVFCLSKISSLYYHKSRYYAARKLTAIESFCLHFKQLTCLEYLETVEKQFYTFLNKQYQYMFWSEVYSNKFPGIVTAVMMLGGLYLNHCDTNVNTDDTVKILILIIFYVFFVKNLFVEYSEAVDAIIRGKESIEKFKNANYLNEPSLSQERSEENKLMTIRDAEFKWEEPGTNAEQSKKNNRKSRIAQQRNLNLNVLNFEIPKRSIIGIAGDSQSGKTMLLYSILGHTNLERGTVKHKGKCAFFPKKPFLRPGSIKSNIIMESDELDQNLYYRAITTVRLNEDLNVALDNEDMTINVMDLNDLEIERIIMARAIYSKSDILVLDDPFNYILCHKSEMFYDILNIMKICNKTLVIATNNEEILRLCNNVYYMVSGEIYREGKHEDLKIVPEYSEMMSDYLTAKQCNGKYTMLQTPKWKPPKIKKSRRSGARNSVLYKDSNDEENESLLANFEVTSNFGYIPIVGYVFLAIIFISNNFGYFGTTFMLFNFIENNYKNHVQIFYIFCILPMCLFMDILARIYMAALAKYKCVAMQKSLFKLMCNTHLTFTDRSIFTEYIHHFSINIFNAFKPYAQITYHTVSLCFTIGLMTYSNVWLSILATAMIILCVLLYKHFSLTISHFNCIELKSRNNMNVLIRNNIVGRAVIQSFDKVYEFSKEFYETVEENSAVIYLKKSTIYHSIFCLNLILSIGFLIAINLMIFTPFPSFSVANIYKYSLGILSYLLFAYNLQELLTNYFETIHSKELVKKIDKFKELLEVAKISQQDSLEILSNDIYNLIGDNKGLSVFFHDVRYKISEHNYFELHHLAVQNGEKIIIVGTNSSLLIPILFKLIRPNTGEIRFGDKCIKHLQIVDLTYIIGLVPADPVIPDATISSLLGATNLAKHNIETEIMEGALKTLGIWDYILKFPKKLDEKLSNLSLEDRQLVCLAKCLIKKPPIVIIEKPHPNIQKKIDQCIKTYLNLATIICVTANANQFTVYDRVYELEKSKIL